MVSTKELRSENAIFLHHGEPMLFGKNKEKGLVLDGFSLKAVTLGENGISEKDILVHDATTKDYFLHQRLASMSGPDLPIALGVIRDVEETTYEEAMVEQIQAVQAKSTVKTFSDLMNSIESWEI
jgi:2-oxoglutarate ferredoxin oxidoreductase subunit beta